MDPISQAVLGASVAQAVVQTRLGKGLGGRRAALLGAAGGVAPDFDVLIRSSGDPLMALEFHRHFTHSLAFIPIGGLLVGLPALWWARRRDWREDGPDSAQISALLIFAATTLGWATHGLLDAFTSYGTMLFWPFSRVRVAWAWISTIDLLYTLPLAAGALLSARPGATPRAARACLLASSLYMVFCGFQHARAEATLDTLTTIRGHRVEVDRVQPLVFNNRLWRTLYRTSDGVLHTDTIVVPWLGAARHIGSARIPGLPPAETNTDANAEAGLGRAQDLALFSWFADGWLYPTDDIDADDPSAVVICDARYSLHPPSFDSVFCVAATETGVIAVLQRRPEDPWATLWEFLSLSRQGEPIPP